jgi:hypothetical protein
MPKPKAMPKPAAGGLHKFDPNAFAAMNKDRAANKGGFGASAPAAPAKKGAVPAPKTLKHKYNSGVEKAFGIMGSGDKKGKKK